MVEVHKSCRAVHSEDDAKVRAPCNPTRCGLQPRVRAHATLCAGACHPVCGRMPPDACRTPLGLLPYLLTYLLSTYFLTYFLTSYLPLPYLTTYSRTHAARWQVLLERYSAFLLATLSIEVDRLEQRRMA